MLKRLWRLPVLEVSDRLALPIFVALMFFAGLNLRPALSSLAPVLTRIQHDTGLSAIAIGALTTLPVLCLGVFAPLAPWLARRVGAERALMVGLLLLSLGLLLRGWPVVPALFAGTLLVGAAIGIAGTLIPALVKRELPASADVMTGVYTMALCAGGALGAGLSIPLADALGGWHLGLASWAVLAVFALLAWITLAPRRQEVALPGSGGSVTELLGQPLAWQVMLLMGLQSSLAYIVFGWLPTLLILRGYGEVEAGWLMGASVMMQLFAALSAPWLARRGRDQRPALCLALGAIACGFALLLLAPAPLRWPGAVLLGLGQGGAFSLALALIVLRSGNARVAAGLSGLVQGGGYTLAALGPLSVGMMLQLELGARPIAALLLAVCALAVIFALLAGRNRCIDIDASGRVTTRTPHIFTNPGR